MAPDGVALLLKVESNIAQASQLLFLLLASRTPPFEETLDWLQFAYTADRTGAYVAPVSTVLVPSAVLKEDPLFLAIWRHVLHRFPGAYAPNPSTIGTLGPDYSYCSPVGQAPECRDLDASKEGGGGDNYIKKSSLSYQTRVGLDLVDHPPSHNVADVGVAHPSPGVIRMNTHRPRPAEFPWTSTIAVRSSPHPRTITTCYENLGATPLTHTLHRTEENTWPILRHPPEDLHSHRR